MTTPQPGWYLIRALSADTGDLRPVHFHIYGLGAGEKAVGSVTIDQLSLAPGIIFPKQKQTADYSFHSRSDFNEAEADLSLIGMLPSREIVTETIRAVPLKGGLDRDQVVQRRWDGKNNDGKISLGQHQLIVRAWRGLKNGGDWATSWSDQYVRVQ